MVCPFPAPGVLVREALNVLAVVRSGDADALAGFGDIYALPRPWDPGSCSTHLRLQVWQWCDQVAAWINRDYVWRPAAMIPACWPAHPHLAQELPGLACQRLAAGEAADPGLLEEWHRYTLPSFLDRMNARIGESSCRDGRHMDWPAAPRHGAHTSPGAASTRRDLFMRDTETPHHDPAAPPPAWAQPAGATGPGQDSW